MSDLASRPLRWGLLSAGKISHDFLVAMSTLSPLEHTPVAIGARSLESAEKLAKEHGVPKAYGSYQEVMNDPEVGKEAFKVAAFYLRLKSFCITHKWQLDIVYIGAIHPAHLPLGKAALDAGKPVLVEKPLCVTYKESKELLEYAQAKNLFLMEAVWVRFFPAYQKLRELINSKVVGEVTNVFMSFGVPLGDVDRCKMLELGGGTMLDLGIYCTQLTLFVLGQQSPVQILSSGDLNQWGADDSVSTTLKFPNGTLATFITSYRGKMPNEAFIVGTEGAIKVDMYLTEI